MPGGIRLTRSSSNSSLKRWLERKPSIISNMPAYSQSLMDRDLTRSDSMGSATHASKRRSFLRLPSRSEKDDNSRFEGEFSGACQGSVSSQPREQGFETILPPSAPSTTKKTIDPKQQRKSKSKQPRPPSSERTKWRCFPKYPSSQDPEPSINDNNVPPVVAASSSSDGSPQERFDQSFEMAENANHGFDYAFDAVLWDKRLPQQSLLESSRVDTTLASNSSVSSDCPEPVQKNASEVNFLPQQQQNNKKQSKWKRFFRRRKGDTADTKQEQHAKDWPAEPELEEEHDWEARMDGDEVECEYRGDFSVQGWLSAAAPDSPTMQRVSSWGLEQPQYDNAPVLELPFTKSTWPDPPISMENKGDPLPNSTGVMELGQYARELKQAKAKPSPSSKRQQVQSLLCALPNFGSKHQVQEEEEDELSDPDEPDECQSLGDNSYLAVSYTGEGGAQLVVTQSEDPVDHREREVQQTEEAPPPETKEVPPPESTEMQEDKESGKSHLKGNEHPPPLPLDMTASCLTMDESLYFLGENPVNSYISAHTLGASYPHPAAQIPQALTHPSPRTSDEAEKTPQKQEKSTSVPHNATEDVSSIKTPPNVEKEVQGRITFHHYKALPPLNLHGPNKSSFRPTSASSSQPSHQQGARHPRPEAPWMPRRRDDPPVGEEGPRRFRFYSCPAPTGMPAAYPTCNTGSSHRWLSQPTERTWDHTASGTMDTSRTFSTLSNSEFPLQERRSFASTGDVWDFYYPIQKLATNVNHTFCENLYPRVEQPACAPFDEYQMDMQSRPRWTKVVKTKSSSSWTSDYEHDRRQRGPPRPRRPARSLEEAETEPDPPPALPRPRDTRRQLL